MDSYEFILTRKLSKIIGSKVIKEEKRDSIDAGEPNIDTPIDNNYNTNTPKHKEQYTFIPPNEEAIDEVVHFIKDKVRTERQRGERGEMMMGLRRGAKRQVSASYFAGIFAVVVYSRPSHPPIQHTRLL